MVRSFLPRSDPKAYLVLTRSSLRRCCRGFVLERTCVDAECTAGCSGSNFHRACRFFDFKPHYDVTLRTPESLKEQNALKVS
jgi:hypothetical protein